MGEVNFLILLARGADKEVKDRKGCKAIHFTSRVKRTRREVIVALVGSMARIHLMRTSSENLSGECSTAKPNINYIV